MTFFLNRATGDHLDAIIGLVEEAAAWLRGKDTDQWAQPWPSREARDWRIRTDLSAGKTWIAWHASGPAATITAERAPDQKLRADWDAQPATYVRRLVVSRRFAGRGLGSELLNWAGRRAARRYGARWIRIDVWTTNNALHKYYEDQGFTRAGFCSDPDYPSGVLLQKATAWIAELNAHLVEEEIPRRRAMTDTERQTVRVPSARNHQARVSARNRRCLK